MQSMPLELEIAFRVILLAVLSVIAYSLWESETALP
jgi:hypothetical protein